MTTVDLNPGSSPFLVVNIDGPQIGAVHPRPGLQFLGPAVPDGQQIIEFTEGVYEMVASSHPYVFLDYTSSGAGDPGELRVALSSTNTVHSIPYTGSYGEPRAALIVAAPCFVTAIPNIPTHRGFTHAPGGCRIQQIALTSYTPGDSTGTILSHLVFGSASTVTWGAAEGEVDWAVPSGLIFRHASTIQALGQSLEPVPPRHYRLDRRFLINVDVTTLGSASSLPILLDDQQDVGYQITFGPGVFSDPGGSYSGRWAIGDGEAAQFSNPVDGSSDEMAIPNTEFFQGVNGAVEQWWTIVPDLDDPPEDAAHCTVFGGLITDVNSSSNVQLSVAVDALAGSLSDYRIDFLTNTTGNPTPPSGLLSGGPWTIGPMSPAEVVAYSVSRVDGGLINGSAIMRATDTEFGLSWDVTVQCLGSGWRRGPRRWSSAPDSFA